MKRSSRYFITLALIAVLALTSISMVSAADDGADQLPGSGWWTGAGIQNVGDDTATITIESYSTDPSKPKVVSNTYQIQKDALRNFLPDELGITGQFQGSSTVSSNKPLRAIVNTTNRLAAGYGVAGGFAAAQYQGVNNPANEVFFALAKNNHFGKYTTFFVQNAGSQTTNITVELSLAGGNCTVTANNVEANRMAILSPTTNASCGSGDGTGLGSAKASATQPLAGVVLEHGTESPAQILQATRGFTQADFSNEAFAPTIKNNYFRRFTGMNVQNVSSGDVNITVTYTGIESSSGFPSCVGQTFTDSANNVGPGEAATFVHLSSSSSVPEGCLASAKVEATGSVVAVVNESFLTPVVQGGTRQESTTYSGFPANSATGKIAIPVFKQNSYDKITGLSVQNVSSGPIDVQVVFNGPGGTYTTKSETVQPGAAAKYVELFKEPNRFVGNGIPSNISAADGLFSAVVTATGDAVAVANESTYPFVNPPLSQDKNNYEGFNLTTP